MCDREPEEFREYLAYFEPETAPVETVPGVPLTSPIERPPVEA